MKLSQTYCETCTDTCLHRLSKTARTCVWCGSAQEIAAEAVQEDPAESPSYKIDLKDLKFLDESDDEFIEVEIQH